MPSFRFFRAHALGYAFASVVIFSCPILRGASGTFMDYGPALSYTVELPSETVCKGVTVKVSAGDSRGAILFDTETFRYAAGWTAGWLDLSTTHLSSYKGAIAPRPAGIVRFTNRPGPAWAKNGSFAEPRTNGVGSLPENWGRYRGFYRHGSNIIFSYTVGTTDLLDSPGMFVTNGGLRFTRSLHVQNIREPLLLNVSNPTHGNQAVSISNSTTLALDDGVFTQVAGSGLKRLCQGGPSLWPEILTTSGRRGDEAGPFAVDTVSIPENNPWRSWMRLTALDFFSDGRAAVTTWNGDVWIVSGLDDKLKNVKWKRFAAGLFDPLGIKVVRDEIYVLERSQITRLRDLNGDGEADFYENFNNDAGTSPSYHAFAMDLQTDRAGNFYYTRAGQRVDTKYALNGGLVRVSADGSEAALIAHGLRAANGMSVGPRDEITTSDNQGNWIPSSRLNLIRAGGFYGYMPHAHTDKPPMSFEPPMCWIPMSVDNSGGGQVWVTSDRWPLALQGHLLHTSYGMAALFAVLWETVDGVAQGGVMKLPLKFDTGIQRARFSPRDGQLYVAGLKGWQTKGVKDGAFQRVRFTGKPLRMPTQLQVRANGIEIGFSEALDRETAEDLQNYSLQQWNYRWTEKYGSDDYSVANPAIKGRDAVLVRSARLLGDQKRILLEIPGLKPVMQMRIKFALKTANGAPLEWEIHNTINRIPRR